MTEEKKARQLQKQRDAQQRQREKQRTRQADPAYRQAMQEKALASGKRQQEKQRARQQSPEYRAQLVEKAQAKRQQAVSKPPAAARTRKPARSLGTKGRSPTSEERGIMAALGTLPCIACLQHGIRTEQVSLHHIDGRVKPGAHKLVLPLCEWHHQLAAPARVRDCYPWLVPVHAAGTVGGKRTFEALNGTQYELLALAYQMARIDIPLI
ncbi:recombinase (plasmid) [Nissabacter sp. SGAir0207]|nr:recombinase [Nissabacter sp. SGAir0207]